MFMSVELTMLLWVVILFLVQLVAQVLAEMMEHGMGYLLGARDDWKTPTGIAGRIERSYFNLLETMPAFAALILIALYTGKVNEMTALGSQIYFWGRLVYFPVYISGIPVIRTLVWIASTAGLVLILWQLLV
jgi:uncharacterized MAPEG superfamily protein